MPLLVRAIRRLPVERTPVWFMRQAGRTLPAYRRIRRRHTLFEICANAPLCAEVTLQPMAALGVDAAIMFADIMLPIIAMGVQVELIDGVGPVVKDPIRTMAQVNALRIPDPHESLPAVLEAVSLVRRELAPELALIGFAGAPFTLAGYLIEGQPSRDFAHTKTLMYSEPKLWHELLRKLAATVSAYLQAKVAAGADVIQLFDSWVGALSPSDYRRYVAPHVRSIFEALKLNQVPTIHFGTGTTTLLPDMRAAGGDVLGVDWRVDLDAAWEVIGTDRGIQGNLDPAQMLGPWSEARAATDRILTAAGRRPGHIFNLGHGVHPDTAVSQLRRLVAHVHEGTRR